MCYSSILGIGGNQAIIQTTSDKISLEQDFGCQAQMICGVSLFDRRMYKQEWKITTKLFLLFIYSNVIFEGA